MFLTTSLYPSKVNCSENKPLNVISATPWFIVPFEALCPAEPPPRKTLTFVYLQLLTLSVLVVVSAYVDVEPCSLPDNTVLPSLPAKPEPPPPAP